MRTPLIAGNWKMHKTPREAKAWLAAFQPLLSSTPHDHVDLLLGVPATHLLAMREDARDLGVALAGQDLSQHDQGAYTGEVSGSMLADAGASHVIVGHSERRAYHAETDAIVAAKVQAARRHGLVAILCIGEQERDRDAGQAENVVLNQLRAALEGLDAWLAHEVVIAYEPVWAIGTGRTATAEDAQAMCAAIRTDLRTRHGNLADEIRILYGGSMNPGNVASLLAQSDIDGGLIGGASLDPEAFLALTQAAQEHAS